MGDGGRDGGEGGGRERGMEIWGSGSEREVRGEGERGVEG